jgi:hypothetical protein
MPGEQLTDRQEPFAASSRGNDQEIAQFLALFCRSHRDERFAQWKQALCAEEHSIR